MQTGLWEVKIGDGHLEVIWEDNGGRQQLTAISELTVAAPELTQHHFPELGYTKPPYLTHSQSTVRAYIHAVKGFLVICQIGRAIPSFLMRNCSVEGVKPRRTAAPFGPESTHFVCFRVASICARFAHWPKDNTAFRSFRRTNACFDSLYAYFTKTMGICFAAQCSMRTHAQFSGGRSVASGFLATTVRSSCSTISSVGWLISPTS